MIAKSVSEKFLLYPSGTNVSQSITQINDNPATVTPPPYNLSYLPYPAVTSLSTVSFNILPYSLVLDDIQAALVRDLRDATRVHLRGRI